MKAMTQAFAPWALPCSLLLGASLAGCAGGANFQDAVATTAVDGTAGAKEFTLPRGEGTGAPIPLWDSVLVVCPYSDIATLPEPHAEAAKGLNTASSEAVQWLLFAKGAESKRITVERSAVDFCHDSSSLFAYQHAQTWVAEKSDGAWLMTAGDSHIQG